MILTLGGFWLHALSFYFTGLIILTGMIYEYYSIIKTSGIKPQMFLGILTAITAYTMASLVAAGIFPGEYLLVLVPLMLLIPVTELYRKQDRPFDSLAHTFFPLIYIGVPFALMPFSAYGQEGVEPLLRSTRLSFSPGIVIAFFLMLYANDTGAYLTGMSFGRNRLMERISPKKSWEGFIGGMIIAAIAAWFLGGWLGILPRPLWLVLAVIVSISGTYGDLIESMLKRSMGVKDSGTIMPGHGVFLDRFDSAIVAFPLMFLFILLFG